MQLALYEECTEVNERKLISKNVILTIRDLEIIEFIIDMKFSFVAEVFEKFFKVTQSAQEAKYLRSHTKYRLRRERTTRRLLKLTTHFRIFTQTKHL